MRPSEKKTTTESIELYKQTLEGNNYSQQTIKAYEGDLQQFTAWLKTRRVDFDIPYRIARIDIVEFINHLASRKAMAVTRNLLQKSYHTPLEPFRFFINNSSQY